MCIRDSNRTADPPAVGGGRRPPHAGRCSPACLRCACRRRALIGPTSDRGFASADTERMAVGLVVPATAVDNRRDAFWYQDRRVIKQTPAGEVRNGRTDRGLSLI